MVGKKINYAILLIVILSGVLVSISIQYGHNWGGDFSLYINQAKHIVEDFSIDELYELNKTAMQYSSREVGPFLYPNGFPILLSIVYYFFGIDFVIMKTFCSLFFIFSIPLIFRLFQTYFKSNFYPLILICLVAFNFHFITFSDNILSDFPYLFFCFLTLYLVTLKNSLRKQLFLGISLFYAYFIRDVGVFLIPTIFIYQLINRYSFNNNRFILTIPYFVFLILFFFTRSIFPNGGENHLKMLLSNISFDIIQDNFYYYIHLFSDVFSFNKSLSFVGYLVLALSIIGVFSNIKKHLHFIVFSLLNIFILLIWPSTQGIRFVFSIFPFIVFFIFHGLLLIGEKLKVNANFLPIILSVYLVIFSIHSLTNTLEVSENSSNQAYTDEMVEIYDYTSLTIPSEKVVGFFKPRVLNLFSDVKSVHTDLDHFDESIADYLLIHKYYITEPINYEIQKEFENFILYKK